MREGAGPSVKNGGPNKVVTKRFWRGGGCCLTAATAYPLMQNGNPGPKLGQGETPEQTKKEIHQGTPKQETPV